MIRKIVSIIIIALFSFFGLLTITQLVDMSMGNMSTDDNYHAILVLGTVMICCTYLIISKINEKSK